MLSYNLFACLHTMLRNSRSDTLNLSRFVTVAIV